MLLNSNCIINSILKGKKVKEVLETIFSHRVFKICVYLKKKKTRDDTVISNKIATRMKREKKYFNCLKTNFKSLKPT